MIVLCRRSASHTTGTEHPMASCRRGFLLLLAMVASLSTFATSKDSPFTWVDCQSPAAPSPSPSPSSSSSPTTNSTFWSNVDALLDALPSAAAPTGFASLSHGNGTDGAFVRGLCRGDSTPSRCATYLRDAARSIRSSCNDSSRRAAIWYDDGSGVTIPAPMFCFVSYADTNASTEYEDAFRQNAVVVPDIDAFERSYNALMSHLAARVVNGSNDNTATASPAPMFATGAALYDAAAPNGTMYGLLQGMRDRTPAESHKCLQDSVQQLPSCCAGHRGGVVLGYNCYLRMEVYPYYNLGLDGPPIVAPDALVGQRQGIKGVYMTLAIAFSVGTVLTAVIIAGVFLYRRKINRRKTPPAFFMKGNGSSKEEDLGYDGIKSCNKKFLGRKQTWRGRFRRSVQGYTTGWDRDSCEEAFTELLTGVPRA